MADEIRVENPTPDVTAEARGLGVGVGVGKTILDHRFGDYPDHPFGTFMTLPLA